MANPRTFTGAEARRLLRRARTATLATLNRDGGHPYASLANVAADLGGSPILLISRLAWHTQNLLADPRSSLMVAEPAAEGDALTGARATFIGSMSEVKDEGVRRRYLARHPEAEFYAGFGDFGFWRLDVQAVHAIAGFGRIETLTPDEVFPSTSAFAALADSAIIHMNADHKPALQHYASMLRLPAGDWQVAAIDPDGLDLRFGERATRLEFPEPVFDGASLRSMLAKLAQAPQM
jgi:putative heme iron utilization protein